MTVPLHSFPVHFFSSHFFRSLSFETANEIWRAEVKNRNLWMHMKNGSWPHGTFRVLLHSRWNSYVLCYWKSLAYTSSKWVLFPLAAERKTNIWWSKVFSKINLQLFFSERELFKKVQIQQIRMYANVVSWKQYEKNTSKCPLLCQLPFGICPLGHLFPWFLSRLFSLIPPISCSVGRFCYAEQWKVCEREWWRVMNDVHEHQKVY